MCSAACANAGAQRLEVRVVCDRARRGGGTVEQEAAKPLAFLIAADEVSDVLARGTEPAEFRSHRNTIIGIVESFGGSNVRVFGSVARGDTHDDSDIDVLIDVPAGTGLITIERIAEAIEAAGPWRVDVVTSGAAHGRMAHILDEAVEL